MPRTPASMPPPGTPPDLTSVRTLIKSVTRLARHVGLTTGAIYRWIEVNRIPAEHIMSVANFYDVEIYDLIPLTGSDKSAPPKVTLKPRSVLPAMIKVRAGEMTLDEAVEATGVSKMSLKLALINQGDNVTLLYEVLEAVDKGEMTLDEGAARLGVVKYTLHGLRKRYGYAPGPLKSTKPNSSKVSRRVIGRQAALKVVQGDGSAVAVAQEYGMSYRTLMRHIYRVCPISLHQLSRFPPTFRRAYADEITENTPKYVEKWLDYAEKSLLVVQKKAEYPDLPRSWRQAPLLRLIIAVLIGENTLNEVAEARGADPVILEGLFTSNLRDLDLSWGEVKAMGQNHQVALAELLMWKLSKRRRLTPEMEGEHD